MVTKTELHALDLSSFTNAIESLDDQLRANREKLDDIAHAKEIISSSLEGQSAQAMIAKLDALEQKITDHITSIQQTQAAIATYRTNKQQLQRNVIDSVNRIELADFDVSDTWRVRPSHRLLDMRPPAQIGAKFLAAIKMQVQLLALVNTFDRYQFRRRCYPIHDVRRLLDY